LFRCRIVEEAKFGEKPGRAGGIELPTGGIKIRWLFNDFNGMEKMPNSLAVVSK
jgi:hypothetical protein